MDFEDGDSDESSLSWTIDRQESSPQSKVIEFVVEKTKPERIEWMNNLVKLRDERAFVDAIIHSSNGNMFQIHRNLIASDFQSTFAYFFYS